jgi:hypothetical protein
VIEDRRMQKSIEKYVVPGSRGRKSKYESRAPELRQKLIVWKQTPESLRSSLRALARELGTSHQMLAYLLDGLEIQHAMEYKRRDEEEYKRRADEIRARAKAEGRPMTELEGQQVAVYRKRQFCATLEVAGLDHVWELKQKSESGPLHPIERKIVRMYVKHGYPGAQELLQKCSQQKVARKRTVKEDHPDFRLSKLISQIEERGGVLLLEEYRILYFVPNKDAQTRALLAELQEHHGEVKKIVKDCITRLGEEKYEKIKAEICQRIPPSLLSPLDEFKDTGATPQKP